MSYLANVLEELRDEKKLSQSDISKLSGIPQPQISRWINGEQDWISNDDLDKFSRTVFANRMEQARLLRARLMDLCIGPAKDMVEISIGSPARAMREEPPPYKTKLPPKDERAIALIAEHMSTDRKLRDMILGIAGYYKPKA